MSALKKVETGVPGLDILTLGGIPEGRSTLISGKSGTGKTVVALQIASPMARSGVPVIVVAVEESPEDLQDRGDSGRLSVRRAGVSRRGERAPVFERCGRARRDDAGRLAAQLDHHRRRAHRQRQDDARRAVRAGGRVTRRLRVYYGFEETRPILLRNYREIGMDMGPLIEAGTLKVICRYPEATSLENLLVDLRLGLEELKPSLVVLDSISSIEHASSEKGFRQFMIGVASILREHGRSALITQTVTTSDMAEHTAPNLSTIADDSGARLQHRGLRSRAADACDQDARVRPRTASLPTHDRGWWVAGQQATPEEASTMARRQPRPRA